MTKQRQKLKKILTELEYSHDYLFTDDDIPTILDKIEAVICHTCCCTELKAKKSMTFEEWLIANKYEPYDVYIFKKGESLMHKIHLKEMYKDYLNL